MFCPPPPLQTLIYIFSGDNNDFDVQEEHSHESMLFNLEMNACRTYVNLYLELEDLSGTVQKSSQFNYIPMNYVIENFDDIVCLNSDGAVIFQLEQSIKSDETNILSLIKKIKVQDMDGSIITLKEGKNNVSVNDDRTNRFKFGNLFIQIQQNKRTFKLCKSTNSTRK